MVRFSKEDMRKELQTIFLFEADHMLMGASEEVAERFIGLPLGDDGEYCFRKPEEVDLSRFRISGSFDRGYDFAFRPGVIMFLDESEAQDLLVFMAGTPRAGGILSGGETHEFMSDEGRCRIVADTVFARWKLEIDASGAGDHTFSTRELALLADMTEGAVRNALADKSENGLRAIPGSKNPVLVEHAEASRWLSGRRGFIATPSRPIDDRFLAEHLRSLQSGGALGQLVRQLCYARSGSPQKLAEKLGWKSEDVENWGSEMQSFDRQRAWALAEALDLDPPLFVGKTLEVLLRRDYASTEGSCK